MLIEFRVQNHRSLRDEAVLTLEAGNVGPTDDPRVRTLPDGRRMLCAAALYGANASGKSNVLSALAWMRAAVLVSHTRNTPGGAIPRRPFAFDASSSQPTVFEVELLLGGVRYRYGFAVDDEAFREEWLYAWPDGHKQTWLERDGQDFRFGKAASDDLRAVRKFTRPNSLFLCTSLELAQTDWLPIYGWFSQMDLVGLDPTPRPFLHRALGDARLVQFVERDLATEGSLLRLLRSADLGVEQLRLSGDSSDETRALADQRILLRHQCAASDAWLPLAEESKGTRTMLNLGGTVLEVLGHGGLVLVDELEDSLHSLVALEIVRLFQDPSTNPHNAQIMFTTHDTALLGTATGGEPMLRRDQIWITEKDQEGATSLHPLTDYKPRKGENLERGYLQGRYGGIPQLGHLVEPQERVGE